MDPLRPRDGSDRQVDGPTVALDSQDSRLAVRSRTNSALQVRESRYGRPIPRDDSIPGTNPGLVRGRSHFARRTRDRRRHLGNRARRHRGTNPHHRDRGEHEANDQVHDRATEHDGDLLGRTQMIERAVFLPLRDLLSRGLTGLLSKRQLPTASDEPRARTCRGVHANDLHVTAKQNGAQRVGSLPYLLLPQGRTKAHRIVRNQHAELLCREHVPHLVEGNRRQNSDNDNNDTDERAHAHISFHWPARTSSRAR